MKDGWNRYDAQMTSQATSTMPTSSSPTSRARPRRSAASRGAERTPLRAIAIGSRQNTDAIASRPSTGRSSSAENLVASAAPKAAPAATRRPQVARSVARSNAATDRKMKSAAPRSVLTIWPCASTSGLSTQTNSASAAAGRPQCRRVQANTPAASTQASSAMAVRLRRKSVSASFQR